MRLALGTAAALVAALVALLILVPGATATHWGALGAVSLGGGLLGTLLAARDLRAGRPETDTALARRTARQLERTLAVLRRLPGTWARRRYAGPALAAAARRRETMTVDDARDLVQGVAEAVAVAAADPRDPTLPSRARMRDWRADGGGERAPLLGPDGDAHVAALLAATLRALPAAYRAVWSAHDDPRTRGAAAAAAFAHAVALARVLRRAKGIACSVQQFGDPWIAEALGPVERAFGALSRMAGERAADPGLRPDTLDAVAGRCIAHLR
jgi:hypothetical protein